jgi:hypothetical protein
MLAQSLNGDIDSAMMSRLLDESLSRLNERDRAAIVLRFFEQRSLAETGALLGISEDAAGMRVRRTLDKMRRFFGDRGLTLRAADTAAILSAIAIHACPAELAHGAARAALGGVPPALAELVDGAMRTMGLAHVKSMAVKTISMLAVGAVLCLLFYMGYYLSARTGEPVMK